MEFQTYVSWISSPVQIAFLDLVLGADNAIIIALVCRTLPRDQRLNVMMVGTGAAMLLRVVLTMLTGALMFTPLLRIAGGFVLIVIAVTLIDELNASTASQAPEAAGQAGPRDHQKESEAFWDAILLVVIADGVMSLDNTIALAAVANGNLLYLILGLALSVPAIVFGSWLLSELLGRTPFLPQFAMAVLAWVAGEMIVSDPLVSDWISNNAPALTVGIPLAAVVFALVKSGFTPVVEPVAIKAPVGHEPSVEAPDAARELPPQPQI